MVIFFSTGAVVAEILVTITGAAALADPTQVEVAPVAASASAVTAHLHSGARIMSTGLRFRGSAERVYGFDERGSLANVRSRDETAAQADRAPQARAANR